MFEHDCNTCEFLGSFEYFHPDEKGHGELKTELYMCRDQRGKFSLDHDTLIARFGSKSGEYASGHPLQHKQKVDNPPARLATYTPALIEAYKRWQRLREGEYPNGSTSLVEDVSS